MTQILTDQTVAASETYDAPTTGVADNGAALQVDVTGGPVTIHVDGRADASAPWTEFGDTPPVTDLSDGDALVLMDVGDLNAIRLRVENTSGSEATVSVWVGAK